MEHWKHIPGYEGLYEVSNYGQVRTVFNKTTSNARYKVRHWKQRTLKPKVDKGNSLRVTLWKNGISKDYLVARLVCGTWHENLIDTDMTVNHIDGNRLNNNASNLEWLSRADNIKHGFENNLYSNVSDEIILINLETFEHQVYRSKNIASLAIGRNHAYISNCLKLNRKITGSDGELYKALDKKMGVNI